MNLLHRVSMTATAFVLCTALSCSAFACKQDYCAGSKAPTGLNQVGGPQNYRSGGGSGDPCGLKFPCTAWGNAERANAKALLNTGMDVCAVADQLNATRDPAYTAWAVGDLNCVCYPTGPYVGCREFYMAQPDDGTPITDATWFWVSRCDPACANPAGCKPAGCPP